MCGVVKRACVCVSVCIYDAQHNVFICVSVKTKWAHTYTDTQRHTHMSSAVIQLASISPSSPHLLNGLSLLLPSPSRWPLPPPLTFSMGSPSSSPHLLNGLSLLLPSPSQWPLPPPPLTFSMGLSLLLPSPSQWPLPLPPLTFSMASMSPFSA